MSFKIQEKKLENFKLTFLNRSSQLLAINILLANFAYAARLVMPLLLLPLLSNRLSASSYGAYMYAMAVAQWFGMLIEFGFNLSATRRISAASDPIEVALIVAETQDARITLAVFATMPAVAMLLWSPQFALMPQWAGVAWLYGVLTGLVPQFYYQGTHRLRDVAIAELVGAVATLVLVTIFVDGLNQGVVLPVTILLPRLITTIYLTFRMQRTLGKNRRAGFYTFVGARRSLFSGMSLFKFQIYASFYTSFNVIVAGYFFSSAEIGAYASADRIMRASLGFFNQISSAIFPKFVSMRASGNQALHKARLLVGLCMIGLGVAGAVALWFAAPVLVRLLFGDLHELTGEILRIQVAVLPAIAISSVISFYFLLVEGQDRVLNRVILTAAVVNVPLCLYLIGHQGLKGGAISWVVVEWAISTILSVIIFQQYKAAAVVISN